MTAEQIGALALAAIAVFWMVGAYNRLVRMRQAIVAAWAQFEQHLARRALALPGLLQPLGDSLHAERATFDAAAAAEAQVQAAVARMRARPLEPQGAAALTGAIGQLDSALTRLLALLDQHPALREQDPIAAALRELHDVDLRLAVARHLFNDAAQAYEAAARQWPTALLARIYGFGPAGRL
jgi:LemA protein